MGYAVSGVPLIMGILNVTPDSFSDGGIYFDQSRAVKRGLSMLAEGASIIDVGGESTRPGADPVPADVELERVIPVIRELAKSVRVSVDTKKAEVARRAIEAGATVVNDISASLGSIAAEYGVGWVAMHMQGDPKTMQVSPKYEDPVNEIGDFLRGVVQWATEIGVGEMWIDPGIGFGKTVTDNLLLLRQLHQFASIGVPILVGLSRKRFLGGLSRSDSRGDSPLEPTQRLGQSVAGALLSVMQGAQVVRVHDVRATRIALDGLLLCRDGYGRG